MEHTFTCNLCEALCGLRVEVDGSRVGRIRGDPDDPLSRGHVCPKAVGLRELLDDPDRLREPRMRDPGKDGAARLARPLKRASWQEALDRAASGLRAIASRHGRDAVALYVGNPVVHSHRSALAAELLTIALGSRNCFNPNSQDSNPRLFACMQIYGDALAMPVPDLDRTDFLLMLGANPAASSGSQMGLGDPRGRFRALRARGGRVVLVDPRRTESAAWCDEHLFIRPGGDAALLFALLRVLFSENRIDRAAVERAASGLSDLEALCRPFRPERVGPAIGVEPSAIFALARDFSAAPRACAYARVGVCQNEFGPLAAWLCEALNLVTGNFNKEGGAILPEPAADVAPLGRLLIGEKFARWRSRVRGLPELVGALPSAALAEEIDTPGPGQIRALVCLAGNPVLSTPNGPRLERALEKLELIVAIDPYLNRTTRHADVVLPPKHVFETGNFDLILSRFSARNVVKYSPPIVTTADDTRDDWAIACELSLRLRGPHSRRLRAAGVRALHNLPERIVDILLRLGPHRLSLAELRAAPHGLDLGPLEPSPRRLRTRDKRARLAPAALAPDVLRLVRWLEQERPELVLIGRRHLRSNNSWMHNLPSLTKGPDRARLLMHPDDAARRALSDGQRVRATSRAGRVVAVLGISADVMPGVVSLAHGFGEEPTAGGMRIAAALGAPNANALTDETRVEPVLGTSILNGVPLSVEAYDGRGDD